MKTAATTATEDPLAPRSLFDRARECGLNHELMERIEAGLRRRRRRRRAMVRGVVAALAVVAGALWAVPYLRSTATVATAVAHRQSLALADGSRAELNARTTLFTDFRYGRRIVRLGRGEAFFSVAKDESHTFLVTTPAGTVRVTGTQFNVRIDGVGRVEVTLLEGEIWFEPDSPQKDARTAPPSVVRLSPGQQVDSTDDGPRMLTAQQLAGVTAWRQGRIVLDGLTLAEAAGRLADFHGCSISVESAAADLAMGGTFPLDDLGQFFEALENLGRVQVLRRGDQVYAIVAR